MNYKINIVCILYYIKQLLQTVYFYSVVKPSPDNFAARSLPEDIQIRNARKVELNANVTFITWLAEWLGTVTMLVTLRLVGDSPSARKCMVLFAELWFYVILPNLYLMNTAHNKDRIIDDGLLSTIKNGLVLPLGLHICFCLPSRWRICVNRQEQTSIITGVQ